MRFPRYLITALVTTSCAPAPDGCQLSGESLALHEDMREASGIAASRNHEDVLWVHNDSDGGAFVYAVTTAGEPIGRVRLERADNRDWEDIAVAACPDGGPDGDCIYVADIGDNRAVRDTIGLWIAAEPDPRELEAAEPVFARVRYPDGPRDAEAIAILDDGSVVIVTKGRERPIAVYRSPPLSWPLDRDAGIELSLLHQLSAEPVSLPDQVTGAAADADGRIAVRSYAALQFYRIDADSLRPLLAEPVRLDSLGEPQGEGVTLARRGRVYLVSEAGPQAIAPRLTPLRCRTP